MKVSITFSGGPMEGIKGHTDALSKVKMFCCNERRHVYIYVHQGDGDYAFNMPASVAFTQKFDDVVSKFGDDASVSFTDEDGEEGEIEWAIEADPAYDPTKEFRKPEDGDGFLPPSAEWTPEEPDSGSTDEAC
jgi:hypothetical protein